MGSAAAPPAYKAQSAHAESVEVARFAVRAVESLAEMRELVLLRVLHAEQQQSEEARRCADAW
jgi:hypothetical protein